MYYLPRNVVTDQFVDFLVFSECLCSSRSLTSCSLKLANLLVLAGGSSLVVFSSYLRRKQTRNGVLKRGKHSRGNISQLVQFH